MVNIIVYPFTYQSHGIGFSEWIAIFTLALAPLIAHIAGGVPHPSILCKTEPRWHDFICVYNPTSIIWRYAAIADRRIRARDWSATDMAASNALFWTVRGWDGSEDMIIASLPYSTNLPPRSRAEPWSWESIKTLIITLQGLQAFYIFTGVFKGVSGANSGIQDAVNLIFYPLSILGFFRLFAAGWLTSDFSYTTRDNMWLELAAQHTDPLQQIDDGRGKSSIDSESGMLSSSAREVQVVSRFRPTSYLPSVGFRYTYLTLLLGAWTLALLWATPLLAQDVWERSLTTMLLGVFYLYFMTLSCVIYLKYFSSGGTQSTIIPCVSAPWYKVYTITVWAFMAVMFIVACCETIRMPCGNYTSLGEAYWNGRTNC
ncbi:hypothetical protein EDB81DRAFT_789389 [Dactylonectria macrodidyma]|uniref:Uncharacterized protein n=1 Tax=Dactylonectria macrodidyma TaxID=307937 RepID=A0A9P9F2X1_9HYPO|nr:hypothetical protein EDB81DRAFT_789389 [Dactylonectria macrodidyma]